MATNINQDKRSALFLGVFSVINFPDFSARYNNIALLSKTTCPSSSIAGALAFGLIDKYYGECWSPFLVSIGIASYDKSISSKHKAIFIGFGLVL